MRSDDILYDIGPSRIGGRKKSITVLRITYSGDSYQQCRQAVKSSKGYELSQIELAGHNNTQIASRYTNIISPQKLYSNQPTNAMPSSTNEKEKEEDVHCREEEETIENKEVENEDASPTNVPTKNVPGNESSTVPPAELSNTKNHDLHPPAPPSARLFTTIVPLPQPLPDSVSLLEENDCAGVPGVHAITSSSDRHPRYPAPVRNPPRIPTLPTTEATSTPTTTTLLEAEIAPDVEALEAENAALREQLQRMEEQPPTNVPDTNLEDGNQHDLVLAEPMEEADTTGSGRKSYKILLGALLLLAVLIVVIAVVVAVSLSSQTDETTDDDECSPPTYQLQVNTTTTPRYQSLRERLDPFYGTLLDTDPHRRWALQWLANDDPARLDLETTPLVELHERYVLALLYASTNGWCWNEHINWLSAFSVCRWQGVLCQPSQLSYVQELSLAKNHLVGTLPAEVGVLEHMNRCDVGT